MNEHSFIKSINRYIDKTQFRIWKINDNFAGGVPDSLYQHRTLPTKPVWIEYKYIKSEPKRSTTVIKPNLSALQLDWLGELHSRNDLVYVVVGVGEKVAVFSDPDEWVSGLTMKEVSERSLTRKSTAKWLTELLGGSDEADAISERPTKS